MGRVWQSVAIKHAAAIRRIVPAQVSTKSTAVLMLAGSSETVSTNARSGEAIQDKPGAELLSSYRGATLLVQPDLEASTPSKHSRTTR